MSNIRSLCFLIEKLVVVFVFIVGANQFLHLTGWFQTDSFIDFVFRFLNILGALYTINSHVHLFRELKTFIGVKYYNKFLNKWFRVN